ncbi:hypothetical protein [Sanguibacter suarezii]|uniref:hypothetical protein n=1 Tax=Sanguibacter suarezii TaxID=60921 RepID=UPI0012F8B469|nr:hypothetical protein [Sanguibacter suarezii]
MLLNLALYPAQAAQLPISGAKITTVTTVADRCTAQVSVTNGVIPGAQATTVTVSGLQADCEGRVLELTLFDKSGVEITTASAPLGSGTSQSVTVKAPYAPLAVNGAAVTIGSWGVPAGWKYTPPATVPAVSCAVLNDPTGTKTCAATKFAIGAWSVPPIDMNNIVFNVTSPSAATDVEWEVTINLADPMFKVYVLSAVGANVRLAPGWTCSSMPMLVLRGLQGANTDRVGGGHEAGVWLQGKTVSTPTAGEIFNCS